MQSPLAIVNQHQDELTVILKKQLAPTPVAIYPQFSPQLPDHPVLCWLAPRQAPVDELVMGLVKLVDSGKSPSRIVMLAAAGICDDVDSTGLKSLDGDDYHQVIFAHQYAVKMVDELEIPYTVIRVPQIITRPATGVVLTKENQPLRSLKVSQDYLAHTLAQAMTSDQFLNQSIGISNEVNDNGKV